jgi:glycosyltransferase involved in cell wall biosynthesis
MPEKTRVLMLSKACLVGIYQKKLELIAQQGIELLVLVPPSWKDERGEMQLERAYTDGYRLETLPIRMNGNFHLHFYARLGKKIREFQPHIVHIDEEPYNLATWQALFQAGRVGAKTLFFSWQNIKRTYPLPFRWGESWVMRSVDYALMGTDSAGEVWREKGYTGPMATIPQFGTDPNLFVPEKITPERPFTIGFIGRLVEEKGAQVLLNAVAQMPGDWRLRILGTGPLEIELKAQVERLNMADRVQFDGSLPSTEMPSYYHNLDVFVLPSLTRPNWKEQFGRVLVEAMASGVPVIGSDSGAIPGVVDDGGMIVPEGDAERLTEALCTLRDDVVLYGHYWQAGRLRVLEHFTHAQIALETVRVYRELVE